MSLKSPLTYFRANARVSTRGFTLPELLICIAIIGIVTSLTLVKYSAFDSTVLAKSAAYEIALALREAQINSVSVKRGDIDGVEAVFSYPYGIHFEQNSPTYIAYVFENSNKNAELYYDLGIDDPAFSRIVGSFTLDRGMEIQDICINGDTSPCDIETLDITFRRPEFNAVFRALNESGTELSKDDIQSATIEVKSPTGVLSFIVRVSTLGQIEVYKKD